MTRAIIFVPAGQFDPHAARCMERVVRDGYEFNGLVRDDWNEVQRMLDAGEASVAIVSVEEHLPPNRKPRIEIVGNATPDRYESRTRLVRRPPVE